MNGFQVLQRRRQVSTEIVNAYRGLPVANISDCMGRMSAAGARLRPLRRLYAHVRRHAGGDDARALWAVHRLAGCSLMGVDKLRAILFASACRREHRGAQQARVALPPLS